MADQHYQCPKCGSSATLWQEVTYSGWRALDSTLKPTGDGDVDKTAAFEAGLLFGCGDCSWEGSRDDLVRLGSDGVPLEDPIPGQTELL